MMNSSSEAIFLWLSIYFKGIFSKKYDQSLCRRPNDHSVETTNRELKKLSKVDLNSSHLQQYQKNKARFLASPKCENCKRDVISAFTISFWRLHLFLFHILINTFHSGLVNCLPNVPNWYVFRQLSSKISHVHRTPLKCRQSVKIRTTVVWGTCERNSRSSACRRSNVGLPICQYLSLMQSTVLQIFMKALNITFFQITLYSLLFMIHAKTKPNNGLSGVTFSWAFFFRFVASNRINFATFHMQIMNKLKT